MWSRVTVGVFNSGIGPRKLLNYDNDDSRGNHLSLHECDRETKEGNYLSLDGIGQGITNPD